MSSSGVQPVDLGVGALLLDDEHVAAEPKEFVELARRELLERQVSQNQVGQNSSGMAEATKERTMSADTIRIVQ